MKLAFVIQTQEERNRPCISLNEIAAARELASMSHIEPALGKHRRLFARENSGICKYLAAHCPIFAVDKTPIHDLSLVLRGNHEPITEQPLTPERRENLTGSSKML